MVLNIGEDGVSRRGPTDISDPDCSPTPSDSSSPGRHGSPPYMQYNGNHRNGYSPGRLHNNQHRHNSYPLSPNSRETESQLQHYQGNLPQRHKNSEDGASDAPLDFSVRRIDTLHRMETPLEEEEDIKPPVSPTDSEVGSPNGGISVVNHKDNASSMHSRNSDNQRESNVQYNNRYNNKIGEPKLAVPGLVPISSLQIPGFSGLPHSFPAGFTPNLGGMLGPLPPLVIEPNMSQQSGRNGEQNGKNHRPFKAYPKDPLSLPLGYFGMPGTGPIPGVDVKLHEEMLKRYKDYVTRLTQENLDLQANSVTSSLEILPQQHQNNTQNHFHTSHTRLLSPEATTSPPQSSSANRVSSPKSPQESSEVIATTKKVTAQYSPHSERTTAIPREQLVNANNLNQTTQSHPTSYQHDNNYITTSIQHQQNSDNDAINNISRSRKIGRMIDNKKDASYWERRRKNNEAAKRSRDSRRAKEDEIAIRAAFLEQENLKLRVEVAALKNETAKLRCMLYNS